MLARLTHLFPLWAALGALAAYALPTPFAGLRPAVVPLLGLVMFGMGMTLSAASFAEVLTRPRLVLLGLALQYLVMPLAAWALSLALALPPELLVGMVLVGASPGGTASNVVCYLARGDVALSITLTALSTLLAILATPLLTWLYAGHSVAVPAGSMVLDVLKVVLLPVMAGVAVNRYWGARLRGLKQVFPLISVAAVVLIIAIIVALNRGALTTLGPPVFAAVVLHNAAGLACGYLLPRLLGVDARRARTLAIEVGMQNSGLAVALAVKYFGPGAALPGALFSVWHNLSGALLAARWSRR